MIGQDRLWDWESIGKNSSKMMNRARIRQPESLCYIQIVHKTPLRHSFFPYKTRVQRTGGGLWWSAAWESEERGSCRRARETVDIQVAHDSECT